MMDNESQEPARTTRKVAPNSPREKAKQSEAAMVAGTTKNEPRHATKTQRLHRQERGLLGKHGIDSFDGRHHQADDEGEHQHHVRDHR